MITPTTLRSLDAKISMDVLDVTSADLRAIVRMAYALSKPEDVEAGVSLTDAEVAEIIQTQFHAGLRPGSIG